MTRSRSSAAALIIAGGQGLRFWPASRQRRPKPLFSLDGKTTLIAQTIARLPPLVPRERIFVLVAAEQARTFARAVRGLIPPANLLIEPYPRGTAVAIAYGAAIIAQRLGEGVIVAMPADHYITPAASFRTTIRRAIAIAARRHAILMVGVAPTRPDSAFGYQEMGAPIAGGYLIKRFVEKPAPAAARAMMRSRRFLWNAGIFVLSHHTLQAELAAHTPALAAALPSLIAQASGWKRRYARLKFKSFDYEIVEKSSNVAGVKAAFKWDDVGSWNGLWETMHDATGNALTGRVISMDCNQILARSNGRLMVLLGVENLVAIDTDDALLIAHRDRSQDVRRVIDELKRRGLSAYL